MDKNRAGTDPEAATLRTLTLSKGPMQVTRVVLPHYKAHVQNNDCTENISTVLK